MKSLLIKFLLILFLVSCKSEHKEKGEEFDPINIMSQIQQNLKIDDDKLKV